MKKVTLILPDGYDELLTISCIGHYLDKSITNVATRAFDITGHNEITIDLTDDIHTVERNMNRRTENDD